MTENRGAAYGPVLVAGGTGALGTALLQTLLEGGFAVTATWRSAVERDRVAELFGEHSALTLVRET